MPSELTVAMIGLGGKGRSHASNLARLPGVRVMALCDISEDAISRTRAQLGEAVANAYGTKDPERIFADRNVDAVVISTQHDSHAPLAIAAANAKKHILCEKPLALTSEECRAIEEAVAANHVQLLMGFQARHRYLVQLIKQRIPHPQVVMGAIIDPRWPDGYWAVDPIKGGGNVLSQGVHTFDLVTYFAGADPVTIYAMGGILSHDPKVTPTVDTSLATITYANGVIAQTQIGDFGPRPWPGEKSWYQVFTGKGVGPSACLLGDNLLFNHGDRSGNVFEEHTPLEFPPDRRPDYGGVVELVKEFVACARENQPPTIAADARGGRIATTLALPAFASIRTGLPQKVRL
jgi:myo-inositol 2-dehydrogenase/D-chiro-inositol 1-dehydrogenase